MNWNLTPSVAAIIITVIIKVECSVARTVLRGPAALHAGSGGFIGEKATAYTAATCWGRGLAVRRSGISENLRQKKHSNTSQVV